MDWRKDFLQTFRDQYHRQRLKNPRFSIRAYAKQLGLSPGPTSELIKGTKEWKFTTTWATKILNRLPLTDRERARMMMKMGVRPEFDVRQLTERPEQKPDNIYAYPIYFLFSLSPGPHDIAALANRLNLASDLVQRVTDDLVARGWLSRDGDGKVRAMEGEGVPRTGVAETRFDHETVELAVKASNAVAEPHKEFHSFTFVGSRGAFEELRREAQSFLEKAILIMNRDEGNDEIFQLLLCAFPITFRTVLAE